MKIKEQTRKLAAGCSKHCFEVVDKTDEVSSKHCFEVADRTDEVSNHIYGKPKLTWFEEIFEEYYYLLKSYPIIGLIFAT
ncbi:chlorohydrolase [Streptococcus pneumoniae]|nr:chlorohydrolase [Streptococcus pneumoniae]